MFRLLHGDISSFCRHYDGEPFHALLCDAPYHLQSIVDRFGKTSMDDDTKTSEKARAGSDSFARLQRGGFMGKEWDGGDIAFRPETWEGLGKLLYPGAFGMTFGGSRTAHRMAVAIEDAGMIIHPMIGWTYGSGFPKATRVKGEEAFEGHRYGTQALKPALEPIIVFQKPYDGRPVDNIVGTGAGAINIDGGRLNTNAQQWETTRGGIFSPSDGLNNEIKSRRNSKGRWPANFVITHSPECKMAGYKEGDSYQINRFTDGAKPFGDGAGHEFESEETEGGKVPIWNCIDGCPAKILDEQSGFSISKKGKPRGTYKKGMFANSEFNKVGTEHDDSGGASRFFHQSSWAFEKADPFIYQAKVSVSERNAGLSNELHDIGHSRFDVCSNCGGTILQNQDRPSACVCDKPSREHRKVRNPHPTLKPIALTAHLALLLLPPKEYSPRRLLVPFAGTGSEMIGAFQAGWDIAVGVELEREYVDIGRKRIDYWLKQGVQLDLI